MQSKEFITFLKNNQMPVFKLEDAAKILHCNKAYAKLFIHRAIKRGYLGGAERGVYYLKDRHNEYEVASHIINPSYISMISALAYYGLTTQIPRIVYVISTKQHKTIKNIDGYEIKFRKIKKKLLFGFHKEDNGNVFIADPEKAIVDIYYFRDVSDLDESILQKPTRINLKRLVEYAKRTENRFVKDSVSTLLTEGGYANIAKMLYQKA